MLHDARQIDEILGLIGAIWKTQPDMTLEGLIEQAKNGACCSFIDDQALVQGLLDKAIDRVVAGYVNSVGEGDWNG